MKSAFLCVLFSVTLLGTSARADVFSAFFQDLVASRIPLDAINMGMRSLGGVEFRSADEMGAAAAFFYIDQDEIALNESTEDPGTGTLKRLAALGAVDSSIVIHELWHSYYWNVFSRTQSAALALYDGEFPSRYAAYPEDLREQIQEEGYALYIQEIARDYLQVYMILSRATPEQRKALKANPNFTRLYTQSFTQSPCGYYRGDDGMPVFVDTPITAQDRASVLSFFFGGKLKGDLAADFPEY